MPGVPIHEQDPLLLTHVRSIGPDFHPSDSVGGTPWGALYRGPPHIVFGHNAIASIQIHQDATGLDSGCVYGRPLSAWIAEEDRVVQVPGLDA